MFGVKFILDIFARAAACLGAAALCCASYAQGSADCREDVPWVSLAHQRELAKKAGVSITTVSKALNDYTDVNPDTRKHIQEIARQMNYVPNAAGRCMGGRVDKVIGLLINDLRPMDPSGAVYGVLSGVCHACQDNNIEFILVTTDSVQQTQRPLKVLCLKKQLTGLVCTGFRLHALQF